jgi:hypothetical protein
MGNQVWVTISGGSVAVADTYAHAVRQVSEILTTAADHMVATAEERGEVRQSVRVRVCKVHVNMGQDVVTAYAQDVRR